MKCLVEISGAEVGGAESVLCRVFKGLQDQLSHLTLVSAGKSVRQLFSGIANSAEDPVSRVEQWEELLARCAPDLVVTATSNFKILAAANKLGIRSVWRMGGAIAPLGETTQLIEDLCFSLATFVVVPSRWQYETLGRSSHVKPLPNGVDTSRFTTPSPSQKKQVRKSLGISEDAFVIVNSSRYEKGKRQSELLQAFCMLKERISNSHLLLLGRSEGSSAEMVWQELWETTCHYKLENRVHFLGVSPSNVAEYLASGDVFVFPSIAEGLPNAVLEAMAMKLPIAVAEIPGNCEPFIFGECGSTFTPGDVGEIVERIWEVFCDPAAAKSRAEKARKIIEKHYCHKQMIQNYREFFAQALMQ